MQEMIFVLVKQQIWDQALPAKVTAGIAGSFFVELFAGKHPEKQSLQFKNVNGAVGAYRGLNRLQSFSGDNAEQIAGKILDLIKYCLKEKTIEAADPAYQTRTLKLEHAEDRHSTLTGGES